MWNKDHVLTDFNLNFGCTLLKRICSENEPFLYNEYNLFLLFFFCTEVCPSGGRPESYNIGSQESFIINTPSVLEDTAASLNSGDTITITANNNINNTFSVMDATVTVTGVTKVVYTFYDDQGNQIDSIEVRTYFTLTLRWECILKST